MGIPSFYKWIESRYPRCVKPVIEDAPVTLNGVTLPVDTTRPNPNGVEFDNLYLDMNGIIHPCFHPEAVPAPSTYEEVFKGIFKYIDRIFSLIRPRKLLFLAVDGVAPRAKMNHQRSRRFITAKDAADVTLGAKRLKTALESGGEKSSLLEESKKLDSNIITPGTEFMELLSLALRYYIYLRMNEDLGWKGIKVILSDASVPGEGEHKIMSFIRLQRNLPGYDPNTRHCLYGLDADLIMLALATHEIHFSILREDLKLGLEKVPKHKRKTVMYKKLRERKKMKKSGNLEDYIRGQKFKFLNVWTLREYLARDMRIEGLTVEADLERLIDDFVFMCLFVGNDFLPRIPSLDISKGAIRTLLNIYTAEFVRMGGYLTDSFEVNLGRVQHFVQAVGNHEHEILSKSRMTGKETQIRSQALSNNKSVSDSPNLLLIEQNTQSSLDCIIAPICQDLQNQSSCAENENSSVNCKIVGTDAIVDEVIVREQSWKAKFYAEKFEAKTEDDCERIRRDAVFKYIEGICWVMRYYYEGVCSWQWFYPYHYAPPASDFYAIDKLEIHFSLGEPFKPLEQLMSVLPAASAHALPLFYRNLMTDVSSPILDFYPSDFEVDTDGKRVSWQGICKLPFIEESRLLSEISKVEHTLTDDERRRNSLGLDVLFVHILHPLGPLGQEIISFCRKHMNCDMKLVKAEVKRKIDPEFSGGMNGCISFSDKSAWPEEIRSPVEGMKMIAKNEVLSFFYNNPPFHSHIPRPLPGVIFPEKSVEQKDKGKMIPKSVGRKLPASQRRFSNRSIPEERLVETKIEVKTRKRKRNSKKRKHNKLEGVSNNAVEKLDSCVLTEQYKLDGHQANADGLQGTKLGGDADGLQGIQTEVKSRKKKRRSKKRKVSEACDIPSVEKSTPGEQWTGDGNKGSTVGFQGTKTEVNTNVLQGTNMEVNVSSLQVTNTEVNVSSLQVIGTEVKSKKKKRRPKKRKLNEGGDAPHMIVEKLESSFPKELHKGDDNQAGADGLQGTQTEVNTDGFQGVRLEVNMSGLQPAMRAEVNPNRLRGTKTEVNVDGLQGIRTEVNANGMQEIKTEVKSRKKKRRPRKQKLSEVGDGPHKDVEKQENSSPSEQNKGDGNQASLDVLQGTITEANTNSLQGTITEANTNSLQGTITEANTNGLQAKLTEVNTNLLQGIETEVKSRKRKRRSKNRKLHEGSDVSLKSVEKLESSFPNEQDKGNGNQASACGLGTNTESNANGLQGAKTDVKPNELHGIDTEVNSRKRRQRRKKRKPGECGNIPCESVNKLDSSSPTEQNKGDGNQASADVVQETKTEATNGLQGTITEVKTNLLQVIETGVKSRKRKRKSKNRNMHDGGDASLKSPEKSEISFSSEQDKGSGNQASAGGQPTSDELNPNGLLETKTDMNTNELQVIEPVAKSRKRKPRPRKKKQDKSDSALVNIVEKLEGQFPRHQNDGNSEHAGADESKVMKNEVNETKFNCAASMLYKETESRMLQEQSEGHNRDAGTDGMQERKQESTLGEGNSNPSEETNKR